MTEDEAVLLDMDKQGILKIDLDGLVWRCMKKHKEYEGYKKCVPHLLGHENHGYICICTRDADGITRKTQAHRLVFMKAYGDIPEGLQMNHKNGVKHDNTLDNLELMTPSQNMIHAVQVLGRKIGNHTHVARHFKIERSELAVIQSSDESAETLASQYGVTTARIYQIRKVREA